MKILNLKGWAKRAIRVARLKAILRRDRKN